MNVRVFSVVVLAFVLLVAFPMAVLAQDSGRKTIVLIFPIKVTGLTITDGQRAQLKDYLDTRLTMEGVYKVMPESQIKRDLGKAKLDSYNDCYDESCRIDLTKTVYADRCVSVEVLAESRSCRVTAKLFDIAQEATETAADVPTTCDFDAIKLAMVATAQQLSGKSAPAAARQPAGGDSVFSLSALPSVPQVRQVGQIQAEAAAGSWNDIDVAAYEAYDTVLAKDGSGSVSPEDKVKAWEQFGGRYPAFAAQASKRAGEWRTFITQREEARRIETIRRQRMEDDWSKLGRLLKLKVFTEERKQAWARAFVDAYGEDRNSNPHFPDLIPYLAASGKAGTKWFKIPGGVFNMGSADGQNDEKPVHRVNVRPFEMSQTEVTVWQYRQCVQAGACTAPDTGSGCNWDVADRQDHPVNCVDWEQAKKYASFVGGRLPTEAEWEYAARSGGKDRKYPWGDQDATCDRAVMSHGGNGCGKGGTWPVCSKPEGNTEQGLCDMAGNVWEWVSDKYHDSYNGASNDGSSWEGAGSRRVLRGGSWYYDAGVVRAAYRDNGAPGARGESLGFRVARSLP